MGEYVDFQISRTAGGYSFTQPATGIVIISYAWLPAGHMDEETWEWVERPEDTYGAQLWLTSPVQTLIGTDDGSTNQYGGDTFEYYVQDQAQVPQGTEIRYELRRPDGTVLTSASGGAGWALAKQTGTPYYNWVQDRDAAENTPYAEWGSIETLIPYVGVACWVEEQVEEPPPPFVEPTLPDLVEPPPLKVSGDASALRYVKGRHA